MKASKEIKHYGLTHEGKIPSMKSQDVKIFIVDDDQSLLRSIRRLMNSAGYVDVETYGSAEDFLSGAVIETPCVLILDLMLPGMGGVTLYHHLKSKGLAFKTVFISAHDDELKRAMTECGEALAYLSKPFDGKDMFGALQSISGG